MVKETVLSEKVNVRVIKEEGSKLTELRLRKGSLNFSTFLDGDVHILSGQYDLVLRSSGKSEIVSKPEESSFQRRPTISNQPNEKLHEQGEN